MHGEVCNRCDASLPWRSPTATPSSTMPVQDTLRQLWLAVFPGSPFPDGVKSERWKAMGWQSDLPTRDIRHVFCFSQLSRNAKEERCRSIAC